MYYDPQKQIRQKVKKRGKKSFKSTGSRDIRGFVVKDLWNRKIGTVTEIYCDRFDLEPRYIEITPLTSLEAKIFIYPIHYVNWNSNGPAYIDSSFESLKRYESYSLDYIMFHEGKYLISFSETYCHETSLSSNYKDRCA